MHYTLYLLHIKLAATSPHEDKCNNGFSTRTTPMVGCAHCGMRSLTHRHFSTKEQP